MKEIIGKILPRSFYLNETLTVARGLLGCILVVNDCPNAISQIDGGRVSIQLRTGIAAGRIVETEGYLGHADSACHSYNKKPGGRTNIMFGEGGYAYIYFIYGMYYCLNTVTREEGEPQGVLIRALEPLGEGINTKAYSGPGKLCRELNITKDDYGTDLTKNSRLFILKPDDYQTPDIGSSIRIGVQNSGAGATLPYRFYQRGNKSVSGRLSMRQ